ncbi:MAG: glycosyltransferase family 4 protein [Actinomycetota bacterium]
MRIAQVVRNGSIRGGAETYVATLSEGLRAAGHEVALVYGSEPDPTRPEVVAGSQLEALADPEAATDPAGLQAALRTFAPDVIHAHIPEAPWVTQACSSVAPTLLAVQDHKLNCPTGTKYWTSWGKACTVKPGVWCLGYNLVAHCGSMRANATLQPYKTWKRASASVRKQPVTVQVFSEFMRELVEPVIGRRVVVTHYPAPPVQAGAWFQPPETSASQAPVMSGQQDPARDRRPVVLAMGRLTREKGFRYLLDAVGGVGTRCHFVIVGDGHDRAALEKRAKNASGGHRITFTGWLGSVERDRWLRKAKLVVVPSMWPEPFGIVGLEAMAAGKPVLAFDSGGISEWLTDGVTGVLVQPGDREELARRMSRLIADPERLEELGGAGQRLVAERFSLIEHVRTIEELYRGLPA